MDHREKQTSEKEHTRASNVMFKQLGAECRDKKVSAPSQGRSLSLDIPSYRTFPEPRRRRRISGYISNVSTTKARVTFLDGLTRQFAARAAQRVCVIPDVIIHLRKAVPTENFSFPAGGEVFSLDIPFYRTPRGNGEHPIDRTYGHGAIPRPYQLG